MRPALSIEHTCLRSVPLRGDRDPTSPISQLTDRQLLSVAMQAAALIAHLKAVGWKLIGELGQASIEDGLLAGVVAQPGSDPVPVHQRLRTFLLALFNCESEIVGRGEARGSARRLTESWSQPLAPLSATEVLRQILRQAEFLWDQEFVAARKSLFAVVDGEKVPRVVGPASFCLRVERRLAAGDEVDRILRTDDLRTDWDGAHSKDPAELASGGRWSEAVSSFRVHGARGPERRLLFAECLQATGKFEQALDVLGNIPDPRAEPIRVRCLSRLQRMEAARRRLIRLGKSRMSPHLAVDIGDTALRVFGIRGDAARVEEWEGRLRRIRTPELVAHAKSTLAAAACDAEDPEKASVLLAECTDLVEDPVHGWRWYYADGLRALAERSGPEAVGALSTALLGYRRAMTPVRAALLWTNMVAASELCGDLQSAERAARKAWLLGKGFEGPLPNTLLLYNLVEALLKRGKVEGVQDLLAAAVHTDRSAGNQRGLAHDAELAARYHLTRGRADRALRAVDEHLTADMTGWRRQELQVWAGRALGLMGRSSEARERLRKTDLAVPSCLDREEVPALWALAGDPERAAETATGPLAEIWKGVLVGEPPSHKQWQLMDLLDPYPSARLVRDLELACPGSVPRQYRLRAIRSLRELGLERPARELEGRPGSAWSAVGEFFDAEAGGDLESLFRNAGYGDVRLEWDGPGAEVVVKGRGGAERRVFDFATGSLILDAPAIDEVLSALVTLTGRELGTRRTRPAGVSSGEGGIVGESAALKFALAHAKRFAPADIEVLILGETGTGKELVARWIHRMSSRSGGDFVAVNCGAISDSLRNSELFGHVRGAFTGADRDREGYFEAAGDGTIFLDEIGDLSLEAQAGLLRVLQEGEVTRVGESRPRKVDTRVIAATHRDLNRMMDDGQFRQDLFYRLNRSVIELPPLRDRGEDIVLLAEHFVGEWSTEGRPVALDREAVEGLRSYDWPGNVRELQGVLEAASLLSDDGRIRKQDLRMPSGAQPSHSSLQAEVADLRRRRIIEELERAGGNQAQAARALGLTRQGLSYWIRKLGIDK